VVTYSEFQTWQRFIKIVRQDGKMQSAMAGSMRNDNRDVPSEAADEVEVWKALAGYANSFFKDASQDRQRAIHLLSEWFYRPPAGALSVEWSPLREEPELLDKLQRRAH
jgi:hypothetical protein